MNDEAARQGRPDNYTNRTSELSKRGGGLTRLQLAQTRLRELIASSMETLERDERGVFLQIVAARVAREIAQQTRWSR